MVLSELPVVGILQGLIGFIGGIFLTLFALYVRNQLEDEEWNEERIYRPVYNEVVEAANGELPHEEQEREYNPKTYRTIWDDFDEYSKLQIDRTLRKALEEYARKIRKFDDLQDEGDPNRYVDALPAEMIEFDNDEPRLILEQREGGGTYTKLRGFLAIICEDIIESNTAEELRERIDERYCDNPDRLAYYEQWDQDHPDWFRSLFKAIEGSEKGDLWWSVKRRYELYYEIQSGAEKLTKSLKDRITAGFFRRLYFMARR